MDSLITTQWENKPPDQDVTNTLVQLLKYYDYDGGNIDTLAQWLK